MKTFGTIIKAINPIDGQLATFMGPNVKALSYKLAFQYCQNNGMGYCNIGNEIVCEIPCDKENNPQLDKIVDYKDFQLN